MILISGIAAKAGLPLAQQLAARRVPAKVLVGCPMLAARVVGLSCIEAVTQYSILDVLADVDRICMLVPATAQTETGQIAFIAAAANAGVRHVVKLSPTHIEQHAAPADRRADANVERAIADSGMRFTFVRPQSDAGLDAHDIAAALAGALIEPATDTPPRVTATAASA